MVHTRLTQQTVRKCSDLAITADSCAQIFGENTAKATEYQDLGSVSTVGSNTGGSTDVSDTESLEASPKSKHESVKDSGLNKWAPPFVPGAPIKLSTSDVPSVANANGSAEIEVCATVSGALKLKSATGKHAVQLAKPIGFMPPPGIFQEPPTQFEELTHPLPLGLMLQAQIGAPKIPEPVYTEENKLRADLNMLAQFDPACIFLVKKINKLGLNSADFLKAYFANFGIVVCVLASHTIEKPTRNRLKPRVRPAGLAFVVMDKPEDVAKILRLNSEHVVQNVSILASKYERHERWNPGCSEPLSMNISDL